MGVVMDRGATWVMWARFIGLQSKKEDAPEKKTA
jgi:hypothetical protein